MAPFECRIIIVFPRSVPRRSPYRRRCILPLVWLTAPRRDDARSATYDPMRPSNRLNEGIPMKKVIFGRYCINGINRFHQLALTDEGAIRSSLMKTHVSFFCPAVPAISLRRPLSLSLRFHSAFTPRPITFHYLEFRSTSAPLSPTSFTPIHRSS